MGGGAPAAPAEGVVGVGDGDNEGCQILRSPSIRRVRLK